MSKKVKTILIILLVVVLLGAGVYFLVINKKGGGYCDEEILKINTSLEMSETQKTTYDEIKSKLEQGDETYDPLLNLARLKQDLMDYDGAIEVYQKLRKIKPQDVLVLNNLGAIYYNTQQYEKSEEMYLAILDITPKWINSYNELFSIYQYHLKDKQSKIESLLLDGIDKYPEMKISLTAKLAVYYDEIVFNKQKAIEYYEELLVLDHENQAAKDRLNELKK